MRGHKRQATVAVCEVHFLGAPACGCGTFAHSLPHLARSVPRVWAAHMVAARNPVSSPHRAQDSSLLGLSPHANYSNFDISNRVRGLNNKTRDKINFEALELVQHTRCSTPNPKRVSTIVWLMVADGTYRRSYMWTSPSYRDVWASSSGRPPFAPSLADGERFLFEHKNQIPTRSHI